MFLGDLTGVKYRKVHEKLLFIITGTQVMY